MSGGGTRPWAVRVQEGPRGKLIPFVVKLFKAPHLDQHPHLADEMPPQATLHRQPVQDFLLIRKRTNAKVGQ